MLTELDGWVTSIFFEQLAFELGQRMDEWASGWSREHTRHLQRGTGREFGSFAVRNHFVSTNLR